MTTMSLDFSSGVVVHDDVGGMSNDDDGGEFLTGGRTWQGSMGIVNPWTKNDVVGFEIESVHGAYVRAESLRDPRPFYRPSSTSSRLELTSALRPE